MGGVKKLRLDRTIAGTASPERQRAIALIAARILDPGSPPARLQESSWPSRPCAADRTAADGAVKGNARQDRGLFAGLLAAQFGQGYGTRFVGNAAVLVNVGGFGMPK